MASEQHHVATTLEVREATGSPGRLVGVLLPAGRVAGDRPELFVGAGIRTPAEGVRLIAEHRSATTVMRFDPIRSADGSLSVDHLLPDTPEGRALGRERQKREPSGAQRGVPLAGRESAVRRPRNCRVACDCGGDGRRGRIQPSARRGPAAWRGTATPMPVTITVAELAAALRLTDDAAELAEASRLLAYSSEAVVRHAPDASDLAHSEACIRLSAYLYDRPTAGLGSGWSNALRNSGAASLLQPYRQSPVATDATA